MRREDWRVEIFRAGRWRDLETREPVSLVITLGVQARLTWLRGPEIRPPWRVWRAGALVSLDLEGISAP
jgi:hypothetical protein